MNVSESVVKDAPATTPAPSTTSWPPWSINPGSCSHKRRECGFRWPALAARDRDRGREGCEGPLHARVRATTALACGA